MPSKESCFLRLENACRRESARARIVLNFHLTTYDCVNLFDIALTITTISREILHFNEVINLINLLFLIHYIYNCYVRIFLESAVFFSFLIQ